MNELVSIVVPVYNMGTSLEICVNSLLKQDYDNLEIILVDDGSQDNSYNMCEKLAGMDTRVVSYHTENRGSGPARNYGIEHAHGKYIYFPDADDYLEISAISKMTDAMEAGKYDTVVFGYRSLDNKGKVVFEKKYPDRSVLGSIARFDYSDYMGSSTKYGIQGAPWNKLFNLELIQKNKITYPPLRRHQDEGFIGRYMCFAQNVHFIKDVLYVHYVNDLKKEWDKYPIDYFDVVKGLYQVRKETILTWNKEDSKTHAMVTREYICNTIKACELSFSPKAKLDKKARKQKIIDIVEMSGIKTIESPSVLGKYQKIVSSLFKRENYAIALLIMSLKISAEKKGVLSAIRK